MGFSAISQGKTGEKMNGGRGGIRTPDTLSGTPVFKTGAINHSATLPSLSLVRPEYLAQSRNIPVQSLLRSCQGAAVLPDNREELLTHDEVKIGIIAVLLHDIAHTTAPLLPISAIRGKSRSIKVEESAFVHVYSGACFGVACDQGRLARKVKLHRICRND